MSEVAEATFYRVLLYVGHPDISTDRDKYSMAATTTSTTEKATTPPRTPIADREEKEDERLLEDTWRRILVRFFWHRRSEEEGCQLTRVTKTLVSLDRFAFSE